MSLLLACASLPCQFLLALPLLADAEKTEPERLSVTATDFGAGDVKRNGNSNGTGQIDGCKD